MKSQSSPFILVPFLEKLFPPPVIIASLSGGSRGSHTLTTQSAS